MNGEERPFYSDPWKSDQLDAAHAIWDWHTDLGIVALGAAVNEAVFEIEADTFRRDRATSIVDRALVARVEDAIDRFDLDVEHFAIQMESAARLVGPVRFKSLRDQRLFLTGWVYPHGRLLASLAKVSGPLYVDMVDSLSTAFFMLHHLLNLPVELARDHLFIPEDELETFHVSVDDLKGGLPGQQVQKLLWKQCVRIRDYFARALPLSRDLPRRYRIGFRRWWLGGLEMVNAIERRGYDVWSEPIRLSVYHRAQARFQARFARVSFSHK